MGSATGGKGAFPPPSVLEKINEFLKFTIDFLNNFDALAPPPSFKPVADSLEYCNKSLF